MAATTLYPSYIALHVERRIAEVVAFSVPRTHTTHVSREGPRKVNVLHCSMKCSIVSYVHYTCCSVCTIIQPEVQAISCRAMTNPSLLTCAWRRFPRAA